MFITLIPSLTNAQAGHDFIYCRSVQKAAESIGWKYAAAVPKTANINPLPTGWSKCLPPQSTLKGNSFSKIKILCSNTTAICRFLYKYASSDSIIFLESFTLNFLLAFTFALFWIPKQKLSVWLLYRNDQPFIGAKGKICKLLSNLIKRLLKPHRFKLLSDSEPLAQWFSALFNQKVSVMPIPHTEIDHQKPYSKLPAPIICWMAGQQHLKTFNLKVAQRLTKLNGEIASKICLVIAKSANITPSPQGLKIHFIEDALPRWKYFKWLSTCDIVLLPYDPTSYSRRTSGVFVECIVAGKIPLVTEGTWMAKELEKYNLKELIINWDDPNILSWILKIKDDPLVKNKIKKMQYAYQAFHSQENFANTMKLLMAK